ncbi:MAG TPA: hypothetical protein VNN25_16560, partial [Thermoanaerobaculia bacterium]|nr:hypothetical protein [Thermoanaerobaculia bacterium]
MEKNQDVRALVAAVVILALIVLGVHYYRAHARMEEEAQTETENRQAQSLADRPQTKQFLQIYFYSHTDCSATIEPNQEIGQAELDRLLDGREFPGTADTSTVRSSWCSNGTGWIGVVKLPS